MQTKLMAVAGPVERGVGRLVPERAEFEAWAKENRRDLDLRYMYDEHGRYHYDGYIWADAADAFRVWQAATERCGGRR